MNGDIAHEIEQAVAANEWVQDNPELPDDRFERSWTAIAAHGANALEPLRELLADADANRRATAGYVLGRLGEAHESLRREVRDELLRAATAEQEDQVIHAFAVGANLSDLADAEALRLLRSSNASLRRMAT
jgi:hypothetical protein